MTVHIPIHYFLIKDFSFTTEIYSRIKFNQGTCENATVIKGFNCVLKVQIQSQTHKEHTIWLDLNYWPKQNQRINAIQIQTK